ncbi:class I SAM-dependent methyltransferase [Massilia antarctica]|uniref:Class I SAM-dependent methyltransferase n=1 Tax=Massilia antarctica TaxID=2765360 RepID=A0AA48WAY4_9BURK|nr:class I SAM-dependent methyltransferase [Massilia antarctica]QPI47935.1 class I SAM-dependent methyltransferase [Massilia antarctica]
MGLLDDHSNEQERIRAVYRDWLADERIAAYAWYRADVMEQDLARRRVAAALLAQTLGPDLGKLRMVDVGCGSVGFLRQLVDWGADPCRLAGTEYQEQRLVLARMRSAPGIRWHLGDLDFATPGSFDLAVANTVFSSILAPHARAALASAMWRSVAPGGWCMLFDFRYNNPRNPNVRCVTRDELRQMWPAAENRYRSLLLAPPIARRLVGAPRIVAELLAALAPPLRSHFIYMARKPA